MSHPHDPKARVERRGDKIVVLLHEFPTLSQNESVAKAEAKRLCGDGEYPGRARRLSRGYTTWEVSVTRTPPRKGAR